MSHRRYWLFAALLLLPLLFAFSGSGGACALTAEPQLGSSVRYLKGQPLDHRYVISVDAVELADEEDGPPKKAHRTHTTLSWPRDKRSPTGHETAPSHLGGAPVACAAQPRAPPALF